MLEVRAAAEEAEAAGVAGKAALVYFGRANALVDQAEVAAVVVAAAVEEVVRVVAVEARVASNHRITSFEVCL